MHETERLTLYVETTEEGGREEFRLELRNDAGGQGRGGKKTAIFVNSFAIDSSGRRQVSNDGAGDNGRGNVLDLLETATAPE